MHDTAMNIAQNASYRFLRKVRNIQQGTKSAERKYISFVNCTLLRRGKKINIVLVLWVLKMRARVQEISSSIDRFLSVDEHGSSIERQEI